MKKALSLLLLATSFIAACKKQNSIPPLTEPVVLNSTVTTLAGSGYPGKTNGAGAVASFNDPEGVAVDAAGNVYVADTFNFLIRKITPAGVVTTLAGSGASAYDNGTGIAASFGFPVGIAVDAVGSVYVADKVMVRKISPLGVVSVLATGFSNLWGIAVDAAGNVYVTDLSTYSVYKITSTGVVSTLAGGRNGNINGTGTEAYFAAPQGIAVDGVGNVYVADFNNGLRKITTSGVVSTFANVVSQGIAVDAAGNVYADIYKISPAGVKSTFSNSATGPGLAVDAAGDALYVAGGSSNLISKIVIK